MSGKSMRAEVDSLTEEVRALRAELAALRADQAAHLGYGHGCVHVQTVPAWQPAPVIPPFMVTCGEPVSITTTLGPAPGAAGITTSYWLDTANSSN